MEGQVRKLLGILCILIGIASAGWKAYDFHTGGAYPADLIHVGEVFVSKGATVQFVGPGDYSLDGHGESVEFSVVKPVVLKVDRILWLLSAALAFVAGITLLTSGSSARSVSPIV
jgi:hypothetical protein